MTFSAPDRLLAEAASSPLHHGALYALALGTFAVGTEGFMIAALLPTISESVAVSIQAAGQLVTIFAIVYALSSPVLTALTAAVSRRRLLMASLAAFALANVVAASAPGYWSLMAARVLLALAAGLYVPNANALAGALAAPHHRGRALGIVNGGITVAIALGVPLGAFVGAHLGWRATFLGVALLASVALAVLFAVLPREIGASPPAGLRDRIAVIGVPGVLASLLTTTLWAVAAYTVYTYIAPFLSAVVGLSPGQIALVLVAYGASALVGVMLGGAGVDQIGSRAVHKLALPTMAIAFAALTITAHQSGGWTIFIIVALIAIWGVTAWAFFPAQQNRLMAVVGPANTSVILSLNASFMYLGFAIGAALGSVVITILGVAWIGAVGACFLIVAMAVSHIAWERQTATS